MRLSDVELRSLAQIERDAHRDDPRLARSLARGTFRSRTVDVVTVVVAILLVATLAVGIAWQLRIVCAVAWSVGLAATILRGMYVNDPY